MRSEGVDNTPMVHPKDQRIYLKIFSQFKEEDIKLVEFKPIDKEESKLYKYSCPICMRYFSSNHIIFTFAAILVSDCCYNYVCHFCAKHLQEIEQKNEHL